MFELIGDQRALRNEEVDRRHGEEKCNLVFLAVAQELGEVEFGHPVCWTTHYVLVSLISFGSKFEKRTVKGVHEVALHACDVCHG
jgi:hypothetical protein